MRSVFIFIVLINSMFSGLLQAAPGCPQLGDMACNCPNFPNGYCITTGNKKFTYYKIGRDLVNLVAPYAGISLQVVEGGSVDNIKKMRWQNGIKFAIVQSDVLEYYRDLERAGDPYAETLLRPLRVLLPLYNEEVHLLTRADSNINNFRDIRNKRIAFGKEGGGSAMTGLSIYRYMFGEPVMRQNMFFSGADDALKALVDGDVDAWIMVVGQGTERFRNMPPTVKKLIKLVEFDDQDRTEANMLNGPYYKAVIRDDSYPWIDHDIPTVAVKAFLITQKYTRQNTRDKIKRFTQALCRNFTRLQRRGVAKWKDVELTYNRKLPGGWIYSRDVMNAYRTSDCRKMSNWPGEHQRSSDNSVQSMRASPNSLQMDDCPRDYRLLGLCK